MDSMNENVFICSNQSVYERKTVTRVFGEVGRIRVVVPVSTTSLHYSSLG